MVSGERWSIELQTVFPDGSRRTVRRWEKPLPDGPDIIPEYALSISNWTHNPAKPWYMHIDGLVARTGITFLKSLALAIESDPVFFNKLYMEDPKVQWMSPTGMSQYLRAMAASAERADTGSRDGHILVWVAHCLLGVRGS